MGVHGLSGYIRRLGLLTNRDDGRPTTIIPRESTLAIDGNGLIFHLFRTSYQLHCQNVKSSSSSSHHENKILASQLLLPSSTPLTLVHEVTTQYLSDLTIKHGLNLLLYFDGPNQYMKRHEKQLRKERRDVEWENLRQLCVHGVLPSSSSSDNNSNNDEQTSKYRSSARRQSREYNRKQRQDSIIIDNECDENNDTDTSNNSNEEEETYLSSFPLSPLIMEQIETSITSFVDNMSTVLPYGSSIRIVQCNDEADVHVAKTSAKDTSGTTFILGNDTDYLIYGFNSEEQESCYGDTRYIQFNQIDPSSSDTLHVKGNILTRSNVASSMGLLSSPSAMIDLSILLGNDYTGPFIHHGKKRKKYWESIRWYKEHDAEGSENNRLSLEEELSWFDVQGIVEHVSEMTGGQWKLTSDDPELKLAIEFSYALYSFGDISSFPSSDSTGEAEEDTSDNEVEEEIVASPSLPRGFNVSFTDHPDPCSAAILSLTTYMSEVGSRSKQMQYLKPRHLDAFLTTLDKVRKHQEKEMEHPRHQMQWDDMQALYVMEKCLLLAINENGGKKMPCEVFNHSLFHSCLESLSLEDFPLDNELVSKDEREFLEEATTEFPVEKDKKQPVKSIVLPIDKFKDQILSTVKTQRVTIIHGETGKCIFIFANGIDMS